MASRKNRQSSRRQPRRPDHGEGESQSGGAPVAKKPHRWTLAFSGEVRAELGKVDYLNRQQTIQATSWCWEPAFSVGL